MANMRHDGTGFAFERLGRQMRIGSGAPCFVIAEAGVNHNGDLDLAKQLVDAAERTGADAVKFQTWRTDELVARGAPLAEYQQASAAEGEDDQFALLRNLELTDDEFRELATHAERRGVLFLSTPDEERSADLLDELGVPFFKIGSAEVTNLSFLSHVGAKRKPVILSTGMATLGEVERAVNVLDEAGTSDLVLLHCVSAYPSEPGDSNLRAMETLRTAFGLPVGFSDHTLGHDVALAAVALGACVVEKHFTLDTQMTGPDQRLSLDPDSFTHLVTSIRTVESALGDGRKRPVPAEDETKAVVRRRVRAARELRAGSVLEAADIVLRRAGDGAGPDALPFVLGRVLVRDVGEGEAIVPADVQ